MLHIALDRFHCFLFQVIGCHLLQVWDFLCITDRSKTTCGQCFQDSETLCVDVILQSLNKPKKMWSANVIRSLCNTQEALYLFTFLPLLLIYSKYRMSIIKHYHPIPIIMHTHTPLALATFFSIRARFSPKNISLQVRIAATDMSRLNSCTGL